MEVSVVGRVSRAIYRCAKRTLRFSMDDFIFLSALNQYDYCPRRCHYIFVENVFTENEHTTEGTLQHSRANSSETSTRDDALQLRSVYLYSHSLGIAGKADVIEKKGEEIYPIEHKKGRRGDWRNDALQLCAQALCLEEMTNRTVAKGYVYYAATGRRQEIIFTEELRQQTLATITAVRRLIESGERPPNPYTPRCKGCSLYDICLPKETAQLRGEPSVRVGAALRGRPQRGQPQGVAPTKTKDS